MDEDDILDGLLYDAEDDDGEYEEGEGEAWIDEDDDGGYDSVADDESEDDYDDDY